MQYTEKAQLAHPRPSCPIDTLMEGSSLFRTNATVHESPVPWCQREIMKFSLENHHGPHFQAPRHAGDILIDTVASSLLVVETSQIDYLKATLRQEEVPYAVEQP